MSDTPVPDATVWGYGSSEETEHWEGSYQTREQAIAEGCAALDSDQEVWVVCGEVLDPGEAMMGARSIVEWMLDTASDAEWSEHAVGELAAIRSALPPAAAVELDGLLGGWARKWFPIGAWRVTGKPERVR